MLTALVLPSRLAAVDCSGSGMRTSGHGKAWDSADAAAACN
jgi:hypothetical protein